MSTPGAVPPVGQAPPPQAKSKTWLYVLLGCGGCLVVGAVVVIGGGIFAAHKTAQGLNTFGSAVILGAQQGELDNLVKDADRKARIDKAYAELEKAAANGEIKLTEITPMTERVDKIIKGKTTLSDDEADQIADLAETKLASK